MCSLICSRRKYLIFFRNFSIHTGNGMHLYGGIAVMVSSYWQAWTKIHASNELFCLLSRIDTDMRKMFGDVVKVNQLKRDIYRFELLLIVATGVCLCASVTYDFIVFKE